MSESIKKEVPVFDTDNRYAPVAGWLIIPALFSFMTFLGAIIMIIFVNPTKLVGFDLAIYSMDALFFVYLLITYIYWFKRKKILPYLMVGYFGITAIWFVVTYALGFGISMINFIMVIVWIFYFFRSERVKQTFIN